jgi:Leucine-rich repeat (LRR) protein
MSNKFIISLYIILCISSCSTYNTFYKPTENDTSSRKEIYRFNFQNYAFNTAKESLSQLQHLRVLNLSHTTKNVDTLNQLLNQIPNPEKLQVLIVDNLDLVSIPIAIKRFTNLKQLSLNKNPQLNLDKVFTSIQNLPIAFLDLQYNHLTELPSSVQFLETLEDLNLTGNNITDTKTFIHLSKLTKLRSLWLNYNDLEALPKTISQLNQLRNLYFEHNNIKELPEDFKQMDKVWVIHAGHNKFTSIPTQLSEMKALLLLHINNCNIKAIPEAFKSKKLSLFGLIIDNNNLPETDKIKWKKEFRQFFVLSMN